VDGGGIGPGGPSPAGGGGPVRGGGAPPWRVDAGLARELAELVGWDPGDGPGALVAALAARVPAGTTAKLAAVAAGQVPPGADPEAIARQIVTDRVEGRPTPAWSCWALCTVLAALVDTMGGGGARVVALRRIDGRAPEVDLHSVVLVPHAGATLLCDPYFAAVVGGPGTPQRERAHLGVWAQRTDEADGRWTYEVGHGRWRHRLRYRVLGPALDRGDVRACCAISVVHSGVPPTPFAGLWRDDLAVDAHTHSGGGCAVREWRRAGPDAVWEGEVTLTEHPDWAAATADLATRTGIAVR